MTSINRDRVSRPSVVSRKRTACSQSVEPLEPRTFLNATVVQPIDTVNGSPSGSTMINLTQTFSDPTVTGTAVEIQTPLGNIPLTLFDSRTPKTVANFEHYVTTGEYNGTIVHRSIVTPQPFIIQGGGFTADGTAIPTIASPPNEPGISNTVGTIAMAKLPNNPNSATDQWFINLGDNSSNLDQQNGGFTVFGQVIYRGMDVVNAIAALPTQDGSSVNGAWTNLPVRNSSNGTAPSNLVVTNIVNVPALTYDVTSDDTSVVNASISGNSLQLDFVNDGTTRVTVTAKDIQGDVAASTFDVNVSGVANTPVTIGGKGNARTVRFTDPNGVPSTATLAGPGNAMFTFNGPGLTTSTKGGVETVTGTPTSITIATTGTSRASTLNVTGAPTIAGISSDGDLGAVNASRASLNGNLTVANSIGRITLGAASGGTIRVAGSSGSLALSVGSASSEAVNSNESIASLTAGSWTTVNELGSPSMITAPSIKRLTVRQTLSAQVSTQALGQANVGTITTSTWSVVGAVGGITAGSISGLSLGAGSVGRLTDRGDATNVIVNSVGNIGPVSALGLSGSRFFAGQPTEDANSIPTAFPAPAKISSVTVGRDGFSNSIIGASTLGRVNLGPVTSTNGGTPFGVAAHTIAALLATVDGKRFSAARVTSADQITAAEAKAGITSNDLVFRIV